MHSSDNTVADPAYVTPSMKTSVTLDPVGFVQCSRSEPVDDRWDAIESNVVLDSSRVDTLLVIPL